jgi:hypothetical protein
MLVKAGLVYVAKALSAVAKVYFLLELLLLWTFGAYIRGSFSVNDFVNDVFNLLCFVSQ